MSQKYLVATFEDEQDMLKAAHAVKNIQAEIVDFFTPFPVHGLDELIGITRTRLPFVTFLAGGFGLILAISFQVWSSAYDWPINVGGKPMLSIPAFIPITFELMVLFGALCTVAAFFFVAKLYPSKKVKIYHLRQLDDKFLMLVKVSNNQESLVKILRDSTEDLKLLDEDNL